MQESARGAFVKAASYGVKHFHFLKGPHLPLKPSNTTPLTPSALRKRFSSVKCDCILPMSRRPSLWSYISFGSPKDESYTLPSQNQPHIGYPEKVASPKRNILNGGRADAYAMNGSQRSRYLKGGICLLIVILVYFYVSRDSTSVLSTRLGMLTPTIMFQGLTHGLLQANPHQILLVAMLATLSRRRSARSPSPKTNP